MIFQVTVSIASNRDFFQNIELLIELVKRDLKARYKNTIFGVLWIAIQPLLFAIVFVLIGNKFLYQVTGYKMDYLSMFAVLIPWQFFVSALQRGTDSIAGNSHLIYRVKFPIILLPLSVVLSSLIDAFINLFIFFFLMLILKNVIFLKVVFLFLLLLISSVFISSLCILFSLLVSFIGDIRQAVPFLTKLSLFALPILYGENIFSGNLRLFYKNIPLVWMVSKTKEIISSNSYFLSVDSLTVMLISTVSLFIVCIMFKKLEPQVVDYI